MTNPTSAPKAPSDAIDRLRALLGRGQRVMLGLVGAPGAGKSTLAEALRREFEAIAQIVPMDGFHLANVQLRRLGRAERKGAPDTFDAAGYVELLRRLRRQQAGETVYAPEFRREIEEPIAGAIAIEAETRLLIAEGNYLLLDQGAWSPVAGLLDEVWYLDIDDAFRRERLIGRHCQFGRSLEAATEWVDRSDEANARVIAATRPRAHWHLAWGRE
ncbi:MAG: nucleoside/nucleotide kinase family protein [Burkholderiales bacterium]|nr:nucleoside/nucleotide kinase family protein [Burkholderiales bacterium]